MATPRPAKNIQTAAASMFAALFGTAFDPTEMFVDDGGISNIA
jgi:hypothetical protein